MSLILIMLWVLVLGYVVWEFINAKHLPQKYAKLKPQTIRIIDIVVAALILFTIAALHHSSSTQNINSFDECVKAGYPVQQTFPRTCNTKTQGFTKQQNL
jgi:hypothetical protein